MKRIYANSLGFAAMLGSLASLNTTACSIDCAESRSCGTQELAMGGTSASGAGGTGGSTTCGNDDVDPGELCLSGTPSSTPYVPPTEPVDLIVADCNNDLTADIIVLLSLPNQAEQAVVRVYNNADGLPRNGVERETVLMASDPVAFAPGNFAATPSLDLAVAFGASQVVHTLVGNGTCDFSMDSSADLGGAPAGISAIKPGGSDDLDDIVVSVASANPTLAIVDSASPSTATSENASVTSIGRVIATPVDANERPDVVYLDPGGGRAVVKTDDGNEGLEDAVPAPLTGTTGAAPSDLASSDLDGDDDNDLLLAHLGSATVRVLRNDGGVYSLGPETTMTAPATRVALGDLDGDGDVDAVTANTNATLTLLVNDGAGVFTVHSTVGTGSTSAVAVAIHDVNADGAADLLWLEAQDADGSNGGRLQVLLATP